jgi:hypothetical protein
MLEMATQIQATVSGALQDLGFVSEPSGEPGSPEKLKITKETIEKIRSLEGKTVEVGSDGSLKQS